MASHMRTDDTPTTERVTAQESDLGRHATSQVIDEGVHVEAQDVRSSRKYFYTPDKGKAQRIKHSHHHSGSTRKKGGCLKLFLIFLGIALLLAAAIGGAGYTYGKQLYASARVVKGQANEALAKVDDLKGQITSGDYAGAQASAQDLSNIAKQMQQELNSDLWDLASRAPVYGGDVQKVRTLAIVFGDLADNALIPVTDELSGLSFSAIVGTEGNIDVNALVGLTTALSNVSDVINRNAITVENLGDAKLDQINEPLRNVKQQMSQLNGMAQGALKITPVLSQMLGADGNTRNYLIVAVSPAEMRAGGGFAGSTGIMYVTDGKLELGEFESFVGARSEEYYAPVTDEEVRAFGSHMRNRSDNANVTPNFPRAATLYAEMWKKVTDQSIDGVISIDPVFLQRVLALTGGVTTSNGWEFNGDNTAELLLNTIYLEYTDNDAMDAVFAEVAELAFKQFTSRIGEVGLTNVMELIGQSAQDHRLQVWMVNEQEEAIMEDLGISGAIETDPTHPVLGVYLNDYSWAKLGWYLDFRTSVDEGVRNADGSMTYRATTTVGNRMTWADSVNLPPYVSGVGNPDSRNSGDMCTNVILFPPAGGSISNVQPSNGTDVYWNTVYGFDIASMTFRTNCEETTTITYDVTTAPEALGDLEIRTTPTCRTFE